MSPLHWPRFALFWISKKARKDLRFATQAFIDTFRTPEIPHAPSEIAAADPNVLSLNWFGHSTVLIDFFGVRILTDPVLGDRVGPSLGPLVVGPKRFVKSPVAASGLPDLDLLVISHAHMDHLDLGTLKGITRVRRIVSAENTIDILPSHLAGRAQETKWWTEYVYPSDHGPVHVIPFPVKHPGARWRHDVHRTCNAYMLRRRDVGIAFLGDTAFDPGFLEVQRRLGSIDLAIVPIGAYDPFRWNHATPEEAVEIARQLGARRVLPIHHGTFKLSREPLSEPRSRFLEAVALTDLEAIDLGVGQSWISGGRR